jgi:hypothetical protein
MKPFTIIITAGIVLSMSSSIAAQERAQADIKISALTLTQPVKKNTARLDNPQPVSNPPKPEEADPVQCSITVHNDNDGEAHQAMLTVVMPVEVAVISHPTNATVVKFGSTPYTGYLVFNLGNIKVGQSITVQFSFSKSKYNNKVGAFAYSSSPDPNPTNNFKDASL